MILPNAFILGCGHSGTTVLARMMGELGWNLNDADQGFAESVSVRKVNQACVPGPFQAGKEWRSRFNVYAAEAAIRSLESPWVVKDPRFVFTLDRWREACNGQPLLIYITREQEAIRESYSRRRELLADGSPGMYGHTVEELCELAVQQFEQWKGPKYAIAYESLAKAVLHFDPRRITRTNSQRKAAEAQSREEIPGHIESPPCVPAPLRPCVESPRSVSPCLRGEPPSLTIGMAVMDDFDGVYFTVMALRLYHQQISEIIVVDNNPTSQHGKLTAKFARKAGVKYIAMPDPVGTAPPRNRVFEEEASSDVVLCLDSHVLLHPGAIEGLLAYYAEHPDSMDLLTGPMIGDCLKQINTHMNADWIAQSWGSWGHDVRGDDPSYPPFEINAHGLGVFACRKDAWLGFNANFRGFGGEENYIHQKYRQAGRKNLCLPALRWTHRFYAPEIGRPGGIPYPITLWNKVRNYVIGHRELGLSVQPIYDVFVRRGLMPEEQWDKLLAEEGIGNQVSGIRNTEASPLSPPVLPIPDPRYPIPVRRTHVP